MKSHVSSARSIRVPLLTLMLVCAAALLAGCQHGATSKTPAKPRLGVCTSVDSAAKLKAAGYDYVEEGVPRLLIPLESDAAFAENLKKAQAAPLPVYAYAGFLPADLKCVGPEADHDAILAYARTAFARARKVGSSIIVFGSGRSRRVPDGFSVQEATAQYIDLLKRMGPIAAEYDITVVIEPLNKSECNLVNTVRRATRIANAVNHPNIRVLADIYHMALEEEGPESILLAGPLLKHVHLAEKEGRTRPGTANFNFVPYFAALKQIGYSGGISIECRWKKMDEELAPALAYLRQQLDTAWAQ